MLRVIQKALSSEQFFPEISIDFRHHNSSRAGFAGCIIATLTLPDNTEHTFAVMAQARNENREDTSTFINFLKENIEGLNSQTKVRTNIFCCLAESAQFLVCVFSNTGTANFCVQCRSYCTTIINFYRLFTTLSVEHNSFQIGDTSN